MPIAILAGPQYLSAEIARPRARHGAATAAATQMEMAAPCAGSCPCRRCLRLPASCYGLATRHQRVHMWRTVLDTTTTHGGDAGSTDLSKQEVIDWCKDWAKDRTRLRCGSKLSRKQAFVPGGGCLCS
jgi:hypothetical protein